MLPVPRMRDGYVPRVRHLIVRRTDNTGQTLFFSMRTGHRPWVKTFRADQVPAFAGLCAWFEIERGPGRTVRLIGPYVDEQD